MSSEGEQVGRAFAHALHLIAEGDAVQLGSLLRQSPEVADYRAADSDGLTLLHVIAKEGRADRLGLLLDLALDVAVRSGEWVEDDVPEGGCYVPGLTPLMFAARGGHAAAAKLLLDHGASAADRGYHGETAVLFAAVGGSVETLNLLLGHGAAVDVECSFRHFDEVLGWHFVGTPLHAAANCGQVEAARCLLGHGAAADPAITPCGRTPLFYAAARGAAGVVDLLLRAGADPVRRESRRVYNMDFDYTPLHYAANEGHADVVRLLLEAGADPNAAARNGDTPVRLAERKGHHDVAASMKERNLWR